MAAGKKAVVVVLAAVVAALPALAQVQPLMLDPGCMKVSCRVVTCTHRDAGFYSYARAVYERYSDTGIPLKLTVMAEAGCDATCCHPVFVFMCDQDACCDAKIITGYGRVTALAECYATPMWHWAGLCIALPHCGSCECY